LQPDHAAGHYVLGRAYREVGDNDRAAASFERAIQLADQLDDRPAWLDDAKVQMGELTTSLVR
jgi:cytochrome c-type biogenesis protein CcmH/NrfG